MNIVDRILNITVSRVKKFGAQYYTFAIFGLINYPLALLYEFLVYKNTNGLFIRSLATLLSLGLLLKNKCPKKYAKFLPVYWYFTIMINITLLTSILLIQNNFSLGYLINFNIGVMIVILLVDWLSFLIIQRWYQKIGQVVKDKNCYT